ncbi:hypothetical protein, partial [Staphylococcus capitis]|uniref:hypothetical protein n=1 Tax=Staphylococcus capitis TaxID=29388 RepID=UPI001C9303BD
NALLLHKTPTITNATPQLTHFSADHQTLQFLPTPQKPSQHPLPQPILTYPKQKSLQFLELHHFEPIPRRGINPT